MAEFASTDLRIDVEGEAELSARLEKLVRGITNLRAPMKEVGEYLTDFFAGEVFASRGGVFGEPWPALSTNYAAKKAIEFPGRIPLVRTGLMNRSFKSRPDTLSVEVYNPVPYFDYHQSQEDRTRLPRRAMMKVDAKRGDTIVEIIADSIDREVEFL